MWLTFLGRKLLTEKLEKIRDDALKDKQGHSGPGFLSGLPKAAIEQVIPLASSETNVQMLKLETSIFKEEIFSKVVTAIYESIVKHGLERLELESDYSSENYLLYSSSESYVIRNLNILLQKKEKNADGFYIFVFFNNFSTKLSLIPLLGKII